MEPLSADEVRYIARLANMRLTDQEVEQYRSQLSNILQHFQSLQQVDTTGVEPTGHATDVNTVLREDRAGAPLDREQVLANAPAVSGEFIRIRAVLD
jgi:aspartyl-tRNA(Asn)/glutamyl-tRNA(Gln) amidotransferase subunit C